MRVIDADALQELCNRRILDTWNSGTAPVSWAEAYADFKNDIDSIPTLTPQNEWVSVEKRLPEDDAPAGRKQITVMVTTKAGKVTIASRVFEPERDYCGKVYPARWLWSRWLNNYVTHWMPLPAAPDSRPLEGEEDA